MENNFNSFTNKKNIINRETELRSINDINESSFHSNSNSINNLLDFEKDENMVIICDNTIKNNEFSFNNRKNEFNNNFNSNSTYNPNNEFFIEDKVLIKNQENINSYYKGTIDTFINNFSFSMYTVSVFVVFSLLILVDGGEMTVISLLVTKLGKVWGLSNFEKGVMGSAVFVGFFAGTLVSGKVSDVSGRKPIFLIGNLIVTLFAIASAFSPDYAWFTIFRGFCGFGVGLALPSSAALSAEICPSQYRGVLINVLTIFFPIGEIITAIIAKSLLKDSENGWRFLLLIISVPMIIAFLLSLVIRESPRFLANNHEFEKAYEEIENLMGGNRKLTNIEKFNIKQEVLIASENCTIESSYLSLFSKQFLRLNLSVCFLLFSCSFIYYGVVYVLPEGLERNYNKTEIESISSVSDQEDINYLRMLLDNDEEVSAEYYDSHASLDNKYSNISKFYQQQDIFENSTIDDSDLDEVFDGVIYSALSEIPSPIFGMILVNTPILGRRYSIAVGFIIVSVFSSLSIYFNNNLVVWASLLKFGINIPYSIGYLYVSEVFPTKIRSIAIGFTNSFTRLGGIVTPILSQWLFDLHYTYPYYAYTIDAGLSVLLAFSLQVETYGRILE